MVEIDLLEDGLAPNLFVVLTIKRKMSAEHEVDDDAKRPTVNAFIVWLLQQNLRCHIAQGPIRLSASLRRTESPGESEIDELDGRRVRLVDHQNVLRFQISMGDAERVQVVNGRGHLMGNASRQLFTNYEFSLVQE